MGNVGQCFGPNICCIPGIGCSIGGSIAKVCRKENLSTKPCFIKNAPKCASSNTGVCATSNLCCETGNLKFKKQKKKQSYFILLIKKNLIIF